MPPKVTPQARGRGGGRGAAPPSRGSGPRIASSAPSAQSGPVVKIPGAHVSSIGVKRPSYGTAGRQVNVITNHFELKFDSPTFHQYDVAFLPESKKLPKIASKERFQALRKQNPQLLGSVVYDGRKIMYSPRRLPLENDVQEFQISGPGDKTHRIRITKTDLEINPEALKRYINGQASHDTAVLTAISCFNVALSMAPNENPEIVDGGRSFFTRREFKDIGKGLEIWRGIFQSARPGVGKMLVNVDIAAALFYKPGPLISLALDHINKSQPSALYEDRITPYDRQALFSFFKKLRVVTTHNKDVISMPRVIDRVLNTSAKSTTFKTREGQVKNIANFFREAYGRPLQHPDMICIQLKTGAIVPMEVCEILRGEIRKAQPPPELTKSVVEFATKKPQERLASIQNAPQFLGYSNNPYTAAFGLNVVPNFLQIPSRVLPPPTLLYGPNAKPTPVLPKQGEGTWNMGGKKFFMPAKVNGWVIANYDSRFRNWDALQRGFAQGCTNAGISGLDSEPVIEPMLNPQGKVHDQLIQLGKKWMTKYNSKAPPSLFVVILPENATDIYNGVKHFGDIKMGVATQCLKASKLHSIKNNYFENVALKVNCKLGGVNVVPDSRSVPFLTDPINPTIVLGADAVHPPPGTTARPSFTCVVGSVDSYATRYTSTCAPQKSGQEVIADMETMVTNVLKDHMEFKTKVERKAPAQAKPKRLIMFRDGVSEGQFSIVIEEEVPKIRAACKALGMDVKLTFIVVGKRHHVRFFPTSASTGDRSGNCLAGTIVDTDVVHPIEHDFYLQSHAGLLGTSRPAHYNVLVDDNNLTPDVVGQIAFALTHVYQRSTRSVSIPAPTYYSDIICTRMATHFDPAFGFVDKMGTTDSGDGDAEKVLQRFKENFKPVHASTRTRMYWQ